VRRDDDKKGDRQADGQITLGFVSHYLISPLDLFFPQV
jgi:hypothetical protein